MSVFKFVLQRIHKLIIALEIIICAVMLIANNNLSRKILIRPDNNIVRTNCWPQIGWEYLKAKSLDIKGAISKLSRFSLIQWFYINPLSRLKNLFRNSRCWDELEDAKIVVQMENSTPQKATEISFLLNLNFHSPYFPNIPIFQYFEKTPRDI